MADEYKFILILNSEYHEYLTWVKEQLGVPKAETVRYGLDLLISKDVKYQEYLLNKKRKSTNPMEGGE